MDKIWWMITTRQGYSRFIQHLTWLEKNDMYKHKMSVCCFIEKYEVIFTHQHTHTHKDLHSWPIALILKANCLGFAKHEVCLAFIHCRCCACLWGLLCVRPYVYVCGCMYMCIWCERVCECVWMNAFKCARMLVAMSCIWWSFLTSQSYWCTGVTCI